MAADRPKGFINGIPDADCTGIPFSVFRERAGVLVDKSEIREVIKGMCRTAYALFNGICPF